MNPPERILLLDVDGVLITPVDWFGQKVRRESPEAAAAFFDGPFQAATKGELDLLDHLPALIGALGPSCTPAEFLSEWHEYENEPNLALWEAVLGIGHRFMGTYLATNQERHRMDFLLTKGGLASLADGEFASCSVKNRKPSPEYFAEVTRRLHVLPDRIVFFDDMEDNVVAAKQAGWTSHIYRDVPGFLQALGD